MNQHILRIKTPHSLVATAVIGLLAIAATNTRAQTNDPLLDDSIDQSAFPQIIVQPVDQTVPIGTSVTLSVQANNADGYQWLINGVPADGQTNSSLAIASAGVGDVGLYSCEVFNGSEMVPTRAASVEVESIANTTTASVTGTKTLTANTLSASTTSSGTMMAAGMPAGGPIIVFGTPYAGGGSQNSCPGPYIGFVAYSKSISQGWGWAPISGARVLTATDTNRTDTKVQYVGAYGDSGCAQTTVTIPYPPISPVYRFGIYFNNNLPTSTNYPIVLTGFNP